MSVSSLGERAFTVSALESAWASVLANDLRDDELSPSISRFQVDADERLAELSKLLLAGEWAPRDLTEVRIPDDDDVRTLHIPVVADRVVARAILDAVTPIVDPLLGGASYAYRPGLGVKQAVGALVDLREEGLRHVVRTDIDQCFPSIRLQLARRLFSAAVDDALVVGVVEQLLNRQARRADGRRVHVHGLPQGCALSPLLTNLVLADVDECVVDEGFGLVRYADDIAIAASTNAECWEALRVLSTSLGRIGMKLGDDKTIVTSFEEGFTYLGEDFGPRYPPADVAEPPAPDRRVLYVGAQGSRVRIRAGRVLVESKDDTVLVDVPQTQVAHLVCLGSVGVSAGFRSWALANGVDAVLASRRGNFLGVISNPSSRDRLERVRAQVQFSENLPARLDLGRRVVDAKLRKQITVVQRFGRREHREEVGDCVHAIRQCLRLLPDCQTPSEVMGLEGAAAAAYFPCVGTLMPDNLGFTLRSRRPPADVPNAALSLLYTILVSEAVTALHGAGLDPAIGVLHESTGNRPSLALDLIEEFRPYVVDQAVLRAARSGALKAAHSRRQEGQPGVLLSKTGKEAVVGSYETRMLQSTRGALPEFAGTIRRHLHHQAHRLRRTIVNGEPWTGLSWR